MNDISRKTKKAGMKSDNKQVDRANVLPLEQTMNQLKESFERWQSISGGAKEDPTIANSNDVKAVHPDWLAETRDLLQQITEQLDDLST